MKRVLIAHVPYLSRGGEDVHVEILERAYRGLGIETSWLPSSRVPRETPLALALASLSPAPGEQERVWDRLVSESALELIHVHNAFPALGPRFFRWIVSRGLPAVMTVHNHRFFCANGLALREGRVCKACFGSQAPWRPVVHNCNGSPGKSAYHALALAQMHAGALYDRAIRRFIAPSPYIGGELVRAGFASQMGVHLLNPLDLPPPGAGSEGTRWDVYYAGRLSEEKGIRGLVEAMRLLPRLRFAIAGDGPLRGLVEGARLPQLEYLGPLSHERSIGALKQARIAVLPSICNEILPTLVLEAFSLGRRCVVPALDSTTWLARGEYPGIATDTRDPGELARAIQGTLDAPGVGPRETEALRARFGMERFQGELRAVLDGALSPT